MPEAMLRLTIMLTITNLLSSGKKTQTASAVKKAINDHLFIELPFPTFNDGDRVVKTEILFDYFKTRYANFGRVA